jgi:hypothetical protein
MAKKIVAIDDSCRRGGTMDRAVQAAARDRRLAENPGRVLLK